jgi:hypothetical protein
MSRRTVLALPFVAALAGCLPDPPSAEEYLSVIRSTVEYVEADARRSAPGDPGETPDGPLYVDTRSFAGGAQRIIFKPMDEATLAKNVGRPFEPAIHPDSVLLCDQGGLSSGCWVKRYGVAMKLNLVEQIDDRMNAHVVSWATDRSVFPTRICERVVKVMFRKQGTAWRREGGTLTRTNC